jgi:hypothetical protein
MTDAVVVALITGGAATLSALISAAFAYTARRAAERAEHVASEGKKVGEETAHRIDGRMDELLQLTRASAKAEGVLEEQKRSDGSDLPPAIKRQEAEHKKSSEQY